MNVKKCIVMKHHRSTIFSNGSLIRPFSGYTNQVTGFWTHALLFVNSTLSFPPQLIQKHWVIRKMKLKMKAQCYDVDHFNYVIISSLDLIVSKCQRNSSVGAVVDIWRVKVLPWWPALKSIQIFKSLYIKYNTQSINLSYSLNAVDKIISIHVFSHIRFNNTRVLNTYSLHNQNLWEWPTSLLPK